MRESGRKTERAAQVDGAVPSLRDSFGFLGAAGALYLMGGQDAGGVCVCVCVCARARARARACVRVCMCVLVIVTCHGLAMVCPGHRAIVCRCTDFRAEIATDRRKKAVNLEL